MTFVREEETVLRRDAGPIAWLTLNRPDKLNAINYAMADALMGRLEALERDPVIRAVILSGAGERAFSAGGDIPEFAASIRRGAPEVLQAFLRRGQRMTSMIERFPKPLIVAVNGLAYGGGCEITEAAPLAVASRAARFAKPEIAIGITPTFGGTQRLPRLAGRKRALELLLTGESFGPERAEALGLVNRVVAPEDLLPAAEDLAARLLRRPPAATAAILRATTRGINMSIDEGLAVEASAFASLADRPDTHRALEAWIHRRRV